MFVLEIKTNIVLKTGQDNLVSKRTPIILKLLAHKFKHHMPVSINAIYDRKIHLIPGPLISS